MRLSTRLAPIELLDPVMPDTERLSRSLLELVRVDGAADAVETLLVAADIRGLFDGVVSVDDRKTFKPNPDVYEHLLDTTASSPGNAWLISSNPFDVIGAISYGLRAAWVKRSKHSIFDPWGIEPTLTITSLRELATGISSLK